MELSKEKSPGFRGFRKADEGTRPSAWQGPGAKRLEPTAAAIPSVGAESGSVRGSGSVYNRHPDLTENLTENASQSSNIAGRPPSRTKPRDPEGSRSRGFPAVRKRRWGQRLAAASALGKPRSRMRCMARRPVCPPPH